MDIEGAINIRDTDQRNLLTLALTKGLPGPIHGAASDPPHLTTVEGAPGGVHVNAAILINLPVGTFPSVLGCTCMAANMGIPRDAMK